tara:strand:+ start:387 stop:581 length:195 start_codon:yes stop_codon:yes gene_type:complete
MIINVEAKDYENDIKIMSTVELKKFGVRLSNRYMETEINSWKVRDQIQKMIIKEIENRRNHNFQ